ncbi:hypothetical protein Tco_1023773, partial [Tanacetum coccineum]
RKILESPWGSPIPIEEGDGDANRFPVGDGDGDEAEAEKRGWGCVLLVSSFETAGRGLETDYLSTSYALLNKGHFFTRS